MRARACFLTLRLLRGIVPRPRAEVVAERAATVLDHEHIAVEWLPHPRVAEQGKRAVVDGRAIHEVLVGVAREYVAAFLGAVSAEVADHEAVLGKPAVEKDLEPSLDRIASATPPPTMQM